jgi:cytochrome c peroxidase
MPRKSLHLLVCVTLLACAACREGGSGVSAEASEGDPAEVVTGERLFLETRFAQHFAALAGNDANATVAGDPVVDVTATLSAPLPGPFRGSSMNCRACHLVDEQRDTPGGGVRTYADFARRSPVPTRDDGLQTTPRNSPPLVNALLPRDGAVLLHFDGEFASAGDLIRGTLSGRNFGWLPTERAAAMAHIANVIRNDDGRGRLAADFGALPYAVALAGSDPSIPPDLRLPPALRLDVDNASDAEVLDAVAQLISAYMDSLLFKQDPAGEFFGSPYDTFLRKNGLPRSPAEGESAIAYARRLRQRIDALDEPRFVIPANGHFRLHDQEFAFGPLELDGLRVFLAEPDGSSPGSIGNCVTCHMPPNFTDFGFHNTGAAQDEYDGIHGAGAFSTLEIPTLDVRNASPQLYLPPSPAHPTAAGPFLAIPQLQRPGITDLGLWNVFANPAVPGPQEALTAALCNTDAACTAEMLLPRTVALFKTPGLRDLGQSAPYLHTGQKDSLEDVVEFYRTISALARAGSLRNGAPELLGMALSAGDIDSLAAFLRALNEDYE